MGNLVAALEDLCQMRNELRPITTAVILGDTERIEALLPESEIRLTSPPRKLSLDQKLQRLAPVVDGEVAGFVVNRDGKLQSIRKVSISLQGDFKLSPLLSHPADRFAIISSVAEALVFTLDPGGNRIQVFSDGGLVCRYFDGGWRADDLNAFHEVLIGACEEKGYDLKSVEKLGRIAIQMSYMHLGALFAVVPRGSDIHDRYEDCLKDLGISITPRPLLELSDMELIKFAKEDGAVIANGSGFLRAFMAYLRPRSYGRLETDPGAGARRITAQRFSADLGCLTLVISEDGGITAFSDGKKLFKL